MLFSNFLLDLKVQHIFLGCHKNQDGYDGDEARKCFYFDVRIQVIEKKDRTVVLLFRTMHEIQINLFVFLASIFMSKLRLK